MHVASRDSTAAALEELEGRDLDASAAGEISEGMYAVASLLDRQHELRRAFTDPASSADTRRELAQRLLTGQLAERPLQVLRDLVARRWSSGADLRTAVERLAATAAMRAAEADGTLDEVEDELFRFERLLEREPELRSALTDPGLPDERKTAVLNDLLAQAQPTTRRLVELSVTGRTTGSLESALDSLLQLAAKRRERYVAEVRVARDLEEDQRERLQAALTRIYGRAVDLQVAVDPSVVGGIEVKVGEEVFNGTIARKLDDAARRFDS